jgi:hypothetical protein
MHVCCVDEGLDPNPNPVLYSFRPWRCHVDVYGRQIETYDTSHELSADFFISGCRLVYFCTLVAVIAVEVRQTQFECSSTL